MIDEKAQAAAYKYYTKHGRSPDKARAGWFRIMLETYEAAKASGQPESCPNCLMSLDKPRSCCLKPVSDQPDDCRAAFERWYVSNDERQTPIWNGVEYDNKYCHYRWQGFEAAWNMKRESGWQPIETAPKDGTPIMVLANRLGWPDAKPSRVNAAFYMGQWRIYGAVSGEPRKGKTAAIQSVQWLDEVIPTQWLPLPAAPTNQIEDQATKGKL